MQRIVRQRSRRKPDTPCKCGHPPVAHYTKGGHCVIPACICTAYQAKGRTEFQNKRSRCEYGHSHDSGLEIRECGELHFRKKAGDIKDFEAQKVLSLKGPSGSEVATYKVDFVVYHTDGSIEYRECKGEHLMMKQPWPLKWALLRDMHLNNHRVQFTVVKS